MESKEINSGGWLTSISVFLFVVSFGLSVVYFVYRSEFPITKRSPSSALIFSCASTFAAAYLTYLTEFEDTDVCSPLVLGQLVVYSTIFLSGWLRGVQLLIPFKKNLHIYLNRRRVQEGKLQLPQPFTVRHSSTLESHKLQAIVFIVLELVLFYVWVFLSYSEKKSDCDTRSDLWIKLILVASASAPIGTLFMTRKRVADPAYIRFEGELYAPLCLVGLILWGILFAVSDNILPSNAVLIVLLYLLPIIATLGMPLWIVFRPDFFSSFSDTSNSDDGGMLASPPEFNVVAAEDSFEFEMTPGLFQNNESYVAELPVVPTSLSQVLASSDLRNDFLKFSSKDLAIEGPEFILQVDRILELYKNIPLDSVEARNSFNAALDSLYADFLSYKSPFLIKIPNRLSEELKNALNDTSLSPETNSEKLRLIEKARKVVYDRVNGDTFIRYQQYQRKERNRMMKKLGMRGRGTI